TDARDDDRSGRRCTAEVRPRQAPRIRSAHGSRDRSGIDRTTFRHLRGTPMTLQEAEAPDARPSPAGVEQILLLHHSHFDVGYTHSQPVVWELQREFIDQALEWLEESSELPVENRPKWTCRASRGRSRTFVSTPTSTSS